MTKSEKERLTKEIHRDIFQKISRDIFNVVQAAIEKRLPDPVPEPNYGVGRERSLWDPHEEQVLRDELSAAIRMIAIAHRRTFGGIRSRLKKMRIISDYSLLMED